MADEQKAVEQETVDTPTTETKEVVLSQSKLDALFDKAFRKGAKTASSDLSEQLGVESIEQAKELIEAKRKLDEEQKSDLEKSQETIETLTKTIEGLESSNKEILTNMEFQKVAMDNGIKDADYFKHLLTQAKKADDYNEADFISELKTEKPYLFGVQETKKVDATTSKQTLDVSERIKSAKTIAELNALQNEIT
tara:strand:+ start:732 stop:1316 length:585 start_codon:yes stop_codon:yes gene_type:complete